MLLVCCMYQGWESSAFLADYYFFSLQKSQSAFQSFFSFLLTMHSHSWCIKHQYFMLGNDLIMCIFIILCCQIIMTRHLIDVESLLWLYLFSNSHESQIISTKYHGKIDIYIEYRSGHIWYHCFLHLTHLCKPLWSWGEQLIILFLQPKFVT